MSNKNDKRYNSEKQSQTAKDKTSNKYASRKNSGRKQNFREDEKRSNGTRETSNRGDFNHSQRDRDTHTLDKYASNDIRWWNNTPLFNDATKVPWAQVYGAPVNMASVITDTNVAPVANMATPGIMTMDVVITPGTCGRIEDPVNRCFQNIMASLYAKTNAGSLDFQAPDMAMMVTNMASVVGCIAHAKKTLSAINIWNDRNINFPRALIESCGFKFEDIKYNQIRYVSILNTIIGDFNSMNVPAFLFNLDRAYTEMHGVWIDEDSVFGQVNHYRPAGIYDYEYSSDPTQAPYLSFGLFPFEDPETVTWNFEAYLQAISVAIGRWKASEDFAVISGAISRAYGNDASFKIAPYVMGEPILLAMDDYVQMQFMNATIVPVNVGSLDVTQDPEANVIHFSPYADVSTCPKLESHFLRTFKAEVTQDDIMEMTRYTFNVYNDSDNAAAIECGIDLPINVKMWVYDMTTSSCRVWSTNNCVLTCNVTGSTYANTSAPTTAFQTYLMASSFRYPPMLMYKWMYIDGDDHRYRLTPIGDIYQYTIADRTAITNLNKAALYSIYTPLLPKI